MIKPAAACLLLAALAAGRVAAQERPPADRWVGSVSFKGNKALDDYTLLSGISTSSSSWLFKSPLRIGDRRRWDEIEFRRDVVRLLLLYRQHGYYESRIDTTVDRRDNLIDVTFRIQEGPPILLDTVTISGLDSLPDAARLESRLPLRVDKPFDRTLFEISADSISYYVRNRGYPYGQIFRNYSVDRRARTAASGFDVLPGPHARIGAITVEGNKKVSEQTIRRSLTTREGNEFKLEDLFESQRSLYQSELFRYASVGIAADSAVGGVDSLVRLRVQVTEATPLQVRAGAGYGTIDCFRTSGTITRLNFFGEARRLDLVGQISKIGVGYPTDGLHLENSVCRELAEDEFSKKLNYLASATLTQPTRLLRRSTISVSTFAERRSEFDAYLTESFGGTLGFRFGFGRNVPISLNYRLSQDQTIANAATYCIYFDQCDPALIEPFSQPQRLGALTLAVVNKKTNSPVEPTDGHIYTMEVTTATPWLGSQIVFDRLVLEGVGYAPWHRKFFSARLRGGVIREGTSNIGGTELRYVPPNNRFYAGGPNTVRGYARNEMGPLVYVFDAIDSTKTGIEQYVGLRSSPIGSAAMLLGNVEMRVPTRFWSGRVSWSMFVDAGELWDYTDESQTANGGRSLLPGGIKVTPGVGVLFSTPLGPMRLDVAYNGYQSQPGRLYQVDQTTGSLTIVDPDFQGIPRSPVFIRRLQWHFSVGLAF